VPCLAPSRPQNLQGAASTDIKIITLRKKREPCYRREIVRCHCIFGSMRSVKADVFVCPMQHTECGMGQNTKSLAACVCVCARTSTRELEAEYVENG